MKTFLVKCSFILSLALLGACASTEGKFTEYRVADLSAFADNTLVIMQTPAGALSSADAILSESYLLEHPQQVKHLEDLTTSGERLFRDIRVYSTRISDLSVSDLSEEQRIAAVADSLMIFSKDMAVADEGTRQTFEFTINRVKSQEKFLEAVRSAQPIVNSLGRMGQSYLNDYDTTVLQLAFDMSTSLDQDFEPVSDYFRRVDSRNRILAERLLNLYEQESSLGASAAEEELIIQGLERNHRLALEAGPEWQLYVDTAKEIDRLQEATLINTSKARIAMLSWVTAHERMASGEVKPADWFSIKDVTTAAFMAGRRLL